MGRSRSIRQRWVRTARAVVAGVATTAVVAGIAPPRAVAAPEATPDAVAGFAQASWVASNSRGPALYLAPERGAPAFGYVSPGVKLKVIRAPKTGERVPVEVVSALRVRGYLSSTHLGLIAQRPAKLQGASIFVVPGTPVSFVGPSSSPGQIDVTARACLGPFHGNAEVFAAGKLDAATLGLASDASTRAAAIVPTGAPYHIADGASARIYESPNAAGRIIAHLYAKHPPLVVVAQRGEWSAVRIGHGPYLVGFTNDKLEPGAGASLTASGAATPPNVTQASATVANGANALPFRLTLEPGRVWRVRAGALVRHRGRVIAQFTRQGWAREVGTGGASGAGQPQGPTTLGATTYSATPSPTSQVDAFVAVDDDVAVRGLISPTDLTPVSEEIFDRR